jgi:virginiamycin A acetyltransferase
MEVLFKLYRFRNEGFRRLIRRIITKRERGEFFSKTLRKIYKEYHDIEIGMYSYGGCFSIADLPSGTKIGRYCSFAHEVRILNGNHPLSHKSLHPFFYNPVFGFVDNLLIQRTKLVIENDVWIGQNVTILPSVSSIGNGAVVGAGSVVTENVPPFAVVAGNPAKIIKYRFGKETIDRISQSAWWNKEINELKDDESEFSQFLTPLE